jgi:hypothetical protein
MTNPGALFLLGKGKKRLISASSGLAYGPALRHRGGPCNGGTTSLDAAVIIGGHKNE